MSPLPFLFKQQLEYYTSHFAQPLPSFSKKPTKQENKLKPKKSHQTSQQKNPPQTTQTTMALFPELHTLVTTFSLISSKFNTLKMLDHSPSFV